MRSGLRNWPGLFDESGAFRSSCTPPVLPPSRSLTCSGGSRAHRSTPRQFATPENPMPKLLSALFLFATLVMPATRGPRNPASEAFRATAARHSKAMLGAARLMPADKYGYRPTPAQRSFGETIAHIVSDSHIT